MNRSSWLAIVSMLLAAFAMGLTFGKSLQKYRVQRETTLQGAEELQTKATRPACMYRCAANVAPCIELPLRREFGMWVTAGTSTSKERCPSDSLCSVGACAER